jgi:hypothetical protein
VTSDTDPTEQKERNPLGGCGCLILLVVLLLGLVRSWPGGDGEAASVTAVVSTPAPGPSAVGPATIAIPAPGAAPGAAAGPTTVTTPVPGPVHYEDCAAARAAGAAPARRGDPGYAAHLDGDGEGCASG